MDLSDYLPKNIKLLKIFNHNNNLILFFDNGDFFIINSLNGEVISEHTLDIKNIKSIDYLEEYLIVNQTNGKITLLKQ